MSGLKWISFILAAVFSVDTLGNDVLTENDSLSVSVDSARIELTENTDSISHAITADDFNSLAPVSKDSSIFVPPRRRNLPMAIGQGLFINSLVWSIDKWILHRDYCSVGWKTLKDNIERGVVWDCDALSTNFFDHPYHGAQYYNAARINGFNYYQSSLFTLLGSAEWEYLAETDFPAPNDFFSTTMGGTAVGEVTYRLANIILNNKKRKTRRWAKEIIATAVNPTYGVNRLLYGESWKINDEQYLYHDKDEIPYNIFLSVGSRWADAKTAHSRCNVTIDMKIDYGKWTDLKHNKPFDQFMATFTLNPPAYHIPYFSEVNINGRIHGWTLSESEKSSTVFSINQDFTYFNNEKEERFKGDKRQLLHLAEPASLGPAIYVETPSFRHFTTANAAFITGYTSDYYYRVYNMGSGFNVKTFNSWKLHNRIEASLDASFHYLFTWKGYEKDQIRKFQAEGKTPPYTYQFKIARKAGDKGYATFFVIRPRIDVRLFNNIYASASASWFFRNSIYKYHENVKSHYCEYILSLSYKIQ